MFEEELEECPAILIDLSIYDANTDKAVTPNENSARLQRMLDERCRPFTLGAFGATVCSPRYLHLIT